MKVIQLFSVFLTVLRFPLNGKAFEFEKKLNLNKNITVNPDAGLDIYKFLEKYNYHVETHWVQTEDGYVLRMQRLPYSRNSTSQDKIKKKPAVLLMHGLLSSAVDFVNMGPGKALALILVEAGYDVWLGNNRGNTWSRNHVTLDPDVDHEFWEFSFETCGYYDLPAKIDYILNHTNHKKIMYIGHSQGTSQFFALASMRPEYNEKVALMSALAPVAFMGNIKAPVMTLLEGYINGHKNILEEIQSFELLPHSKSLAKLLIPVCADGSPVQEFCAMADFFICGFDSPQLNRSTLSVLVSNAPAGISLKMVLHYLQLSQSGTFRRFDYGEHRNQKIYGSPTPPNFTLSAIICPVALYYSQNDFLATVKNVERFALQVPNVVKLRLVDYEKFNHLDYLLAIDVRKYVYDELLDHMGKYIANEDTATNNGRYNNDFKTFILINTICFLFAVIT